MPDGVADFRTTTRTQRYIWKQNRHLIPKAILDRYDYLANPDTVLPGKPKEINQIVTAHVGKTAKGSDGLTVKSLTVKKMISHCREDTDSDVLGGMYWYTSWS